MPSTRSFLILLLATTLGCGAVARRARNLLPRPPEVIAVAGLPGGLVVEPGNRGLRLAGGIL